MATYLLKTEPSEFSFADLARAGSSRWDGVANPTALIHLRAMKPGDEALIYHTGDEKAVVGLARVVSTPYEDPKNPGLTPAGEPKHAVVDLQAQSPLQRPVTLAQLKADPRFKDFPLVTQPRLSVMPVPAALREAIIALSRGEPSAPAQARRTNPKAAPKAPRAPRR